MSSISGSRPSPASIRSVDANAADISSNSPYPTTRKHPKSTAGGRPVKQDEQHSEKSGLFTRLTTYLVTSRRQRHDYKVVARKHIAIAIELLQENQIERKQAHNHLNHFIQHCNMRGLNIEHELNRALPSTKHPLTILLDYNDYDGLAILAPFLGSSEYGPTLVHRTSNGVYVGQGVKQQGRDGKIFSAEGRGLFLTTEGKSTAGIWQNNKPRGRMMIRSPADILVDYRDVPIVNGRLNGVGVTKYKDGSTLSGSWANDDFQGPGVMTVADGATLRAKWHKGAMQPGACYETNDGRIYRGDFRVLSNRPHGHATILWSKGQKNGGFYDGNVEDGEPQGMGRYTFGAKESMYGFVYEGPWLNGKKQGSGILTKMVDERRFNCVFIDDVLHE